MADWIQEDEHSSVDEYPDLDLDNKQRSELHWHRDRADGAIEGEIIELTETYVLGRVVDAGAYGQVREAALLTRPYRWEYAVKIVPRRLVTSNNDKGIATRMNDDSLSQLNKEIRILRRASHPAIVQCFEIAERDGNVYIVMELLTGGDLQSQIDRYGPLREREACRLFCFILEALNYCHTQLEVCHRDIKPENLLFSNVRTREIKLVDFGLCHALPQDLNMLYRRCGTPSYTAPEVYYASREQNRGYDGRKVDIWSLGVVLYVMVTASLPFQATTFRALEAQVISGQLNTPSNLSSDVIDLIQKMLDVDPTRRYKYMDIKKHAWCCSFPGTGYDKDTDQPSQITLARVVRSNSADQISQRILPRKFTVDRQLDRRKYAKTVSAWYGNSYFDLVKLAHSHHENEPLSQGSAPSSVPLTPQLKPWSGFAAHLLEQDDVPHHTGISGADWDYSRKRSEAAFLHQELTDHENVEAPAAKLIRNGIDSVRIEEALREEGADDDDDDGGWYCR